jgi:spermidine synthase
VSEKESSLLELKIHWRAVHGVLRLLEPPNSCIASVCGRVFDGTYEKPFILDAGRERCLYFDMTAVQSAMDLDDPERLSLAYTRKMMAFLIFFHEAPRRILLVGLGGGSLAKFCFRHLPSTTITAVEVNPDVIALRDTFRIPPNDDRFHVECGEGASYVAGQGPKFDVILVDVSGRTSIPPQFSAIEFYRNARLRLYTGGVFVMNLCDDRRSAALHLAKIRRVFGEYITLSVPGDGNLIVFAVKEDAVEISWQRLEERAIELEPSFDLELPRYVRRMAHNWKPHRCKRLSI